MKKGRLVIKENYLPINVLKHQRRSPQEGVGQLYQGPLMFRKETIYRGVYHRKPGHIFPIAFLLERHIALS